MEILCLFPVSVLVANLMIEKLNIPADIAPYLFEQNLRKEFQLFCCLKFQQNSRFSDVKGALEECVPFCGLKIRTLRKYFNHLVALHWIGADSKGNYWLRSMKYLRTKYRSTCRKSVLISIKDISKIDATLAAIDITNRVKKQETLQFMAQKKRKKSRVLNTTDDTAQREYLLTANYCGISSESFGNKLGISRSAAQRHLRAMNKCRYVKVRRHFKKVASSLTETDIKNIKKTGFYENHKLRVKETPPAKRNRFHFGKQFDLFLQQHNEYIPNLVLKTQRKWGLYGDCGVGVC